MGCSPLITAHRAPPTQAPGTVRARDLLAQAGLATTEVTDDTMPVGGWRPVLDEGLDRCREIGEACRRAWGGRLPPVAAQTWFSLHRSTVSPAAWGAFLDGFGPEQGSRLLLADQDDLAALPAAITAWGREHLAVGACLIAPDGDEQVLLAPDERAYARLCRLLSRHHEEPGLLRHWDEERCPPPDAEGLIVLVRRLNRVPAWREAGAEVYWRGEARVEPVPPGLACAALPIIRHADANTAALTPVLDALRKQQRDPLPPGRGCHLADLANMVPTTLGSRELEARFDRGRELLARCTYAPAATPQLPPWPLGSVGDDARADGALKLLAVRGLQHRYGDHPPQETIERLAHELRVIRLKRFAGYILTVYELAQRRRTCGRGSAASSIVCYCLGLTQVDPVRYRLVFERFLAPERTDPPDIDLDFPWDERDAVFAAALERCGRDRVALVCTHLHYRRWSALRAAARAHGQSQAQTSAVRRALASISRFGGAVDLPPPWREVISRATALHGAPRHYGLHPGGLVVTPGPIRDLVPVHPAAKRVDGLALPAIAWEKDGAEALGLVKIDILGNRSLAVVRDCLTDLADQGIVIDARRWHPQEDPATRRLVATGATLGCFYIESPAMRQLNAKAGSGDFDRLVIHSSIIRPAANRWIDDYLQRLHQHRRTGRMDDAWFPHPALRSLLSESYGILSYQEDVMLAARDLAGFTSGEQNQLRKALGKIDTRARLQCLENRFAAGCQERGVDQKIAAHIWEMISSFAGYSFCKAHSASYAMVSFQCAWLKAHHPAVFMARVVAHGGGYYRPGGYLEEARRLGVRILGPCILRSAWHTRAEGGGAIRIGLHLVPLLPQTLGHNIVEEARRRPFASLGDFWRRCQPSLRVCESLERAGAFNRLLADRHPGQRLALLHQIATAGDAPGHADWPADPHLPCPDGRAVLRQRLAHLGFLPQMHPLLLYDLPPRRQCCGAITAASHRRRISICGQAIAAKQVPASRAGGDGYEPMAFVTIEDETGLLETVWFPACYARYGWMLDAGSPCCLHGTVEVTYGVPALVVHRVEAIQD